MSAKLAKPEQRAALPGLLERLDAAGCQELERHLLLHSNLPGPRGNLELAAAFAASVGERLTQEPKSAADLWAVCDSWASLDAAAAPVNDPHEFLVFCAALGIAEFSGQPRYAKQVWLRLRRLAADFRWRTREGVAMAMQRLLVVAPAAASRELKRWSGEAGQWLVLRAVVAAVAEPSLLSTKKQVDLAFGLHRAVLKQFGKARERGSEEFRTLRQGLGYTLSVLAAADAGRGWALLDELAESADPDSLWIVKENLKKNRLIKTDPQRAAELGKRIGSGAKTR